MRDVNTPPPSVIRREIWNQYVGEGVLYRHYDPWEETLLTVDYLPTNPPSVGVVERCRGSASSRHPRILAVFNADENGIERAYHTLEKLNKVNKEAFDELSRVNEYTMEAVCRAIENGKEVNHGR